MPIDLPAITYPPELPVSAARDELTRAIREHQVVIVAGATGSGKTTQLPKICLELGRERIGHTQPRRIAARSIAERISEELGVELGALVGYQVRFDDRSRRDTAVKLMTDGVLLAELSRDRDLRRYDTIIIDEAHERSLTIDFLLGYLRQLLPRRPDLKLIVTSATIDPERFARHFADPAGDPAPIVEVSGRTYPVEIRYRPLVAPKTQENPGDTPPRGVDTPDDDENLLSFEQGERDQVQGVLDALDELDREARGDVLVFFSGENEIRDAEEAIRGRYGIPAGSTGGSVHGITEVLPLYGRLSAADQHRVFVPPGAGVRRRIVLATNVAETSLTVPGIKYVVDTGTARISRYSTRAKVQRLPIEPVSRASANQRSGRAGRTSDGIAIRLYSEEDFERRPEFTDPEIRRTSLAAVILQMLTLRLGDIAEFPFVEPPDSRGIKDGLDLLLELGAIRALRGSGSGANGRVPKRGGAAGFDTRPAAAAQPAGSAAATQPAGSAAARPAGSAAARPAGSVASGYEITKAGRDIARLPVDPRFARMIIEAGRHGVVREVVAIVAGLSIQDPRERPLEKRPQADTAHARFADPTSDFLALLNLWNHLEERQRELSGNAFRRLCRNEFVNYLRVREWQDLYRQLLRALKPLGIVAGDARIDPDGIHRSLLAGLLSHIGLRDERAVSTSSTRGEGSTRRSKPDGRRAREYLGSRNQRFAIFPGSALAKKPPPAVMAAELVETSRLFARTVASIDPAWAEPFAGHLVKRSYGLPRWEKKQGSAVADEKVTLYGVPIVPKRRIQLARIDREQARELFIRHALVDGDWPHEIRGNTLYDFDRANRALRRELAEVEERTRTRSILIDDEAVVDFYDRVLPDDVTDVRRFERWWRDARAERPELLTMTRTDLLDEDDAGAGDGYPTVWQAGDQRLRLAYRFEPGADDDGVTVEIPLAVLPRLDDRGFDWLVPGMREELLIALIKALPKHIRRNVVPAADWARRLLPEIEKTVERVETGDAGDSRVVSTGSTTGAAGSTTGAAGSSGGAGSTGRVGTPIGQALAEAIRASTHTPVDPDDFDLERVPAHLRMGFAAVDARGRRLGYAKDLGELRARFTERARKVVAEAATTATPGRELERSGLTSWDLDDLPRVIETRQGASVVRAFPALVDEGGSVAVRVFGTAADQEREHPRGVRRLVALTLGSGGSSPLGYVQEHLTPAEKLLLAASPYPSTAALLDDALLAVVDAIAGDRAPFDRAGFEALRQESSAGLIDGVFDTVRLAARVLDGARDADRGISRQSSLALMGPLADTRSQLETLVHPGFLRAAGVDRLRRIPVYLAGIVHRVERVADNAGRDRVWQNEVEQALALYRDAGGALPLTPDTPARLREVRWMLEELRLSLFAQHLGAAGPVSVQRIRKALAAAA